MDQGAVDLDVLSKTTAAAVFAACAWTGSAQAETDLGRVIIEGGVEFNYAVDGPLPGVSFIGNGDITVPLGRTFGFTLGLDGITDLAGSNAYAFYPTVYLDTSRARFSAGIPRSVIDQGYLPENAFGSASTVGWFLGSRTTSFTHQAFTLGGFTPLGLRMDGEIGNTEVGLSYHRIPLPGPTTGHDFAFAARHQLGSVGVLTDVALSGGFEWANNGLSDVYYAHAGVEASWQHLTGGLHYTHLSDTGTLNNVVVVFGDYAVTDQFTVDAALSHLSGLGSATFVSAGARYDVLQNAYVDANITADVNGSASTVYEVSVGLEF